MSKFLSIMRPSKVHIPQLHKLHIAQLPKNNIEKHPGGNSVCYSANFALRDNLITFIPYNCPKFIPQTALVYLPCGHQKFIPHGLKLILSSQAFAIEAYCVRQVIHRLHAP